jgi:hypothetical protein
MPSNSLVTTPPGSPARTATEIPPRHRPLALVAFIGGKPQAHEGFGGGAGAAILLALFAHVAAGFRAAVQEHPGAAGGVVDGALAGGGEEGFAFAQGDEQQVGGAGLLPEHPFAVDPGGFGAEHAIAAGFCVGEAFSKRSSRPLRSRRVCSGCARGVSGTGMNGVRGHR